jgi:hypothetical protein
MQKTNDFCMGWVRSAGVRFVRVSGEPDREVFCIAPRAVPRARTPRRRRNLKADLNRQAAACYALARAEVAWRGHWRPICRFAGRGATARQSAKPLRCRGFVASANVQGARGAKRQGVAATTFQRLFEGFSWSFLTGLRASPRRAAAGGLHGYGRKIHHLRAR